MFYYDESNRDQILEPTILSKAIIYEPSQSKSARIDLNVNMFFPILPLTTKLADEII
jgi:hypothetical protein